MALTCTSKLLMVLTGEVVIFHVMPSHAISFAKKDKDMHGA